MKRNKDKEAWRWWQEQYIANLDTFPTWNLNRDVVEDFFLWFRQIHFSNIEVMGIVVAPSEVQDQNGKPASGWCFNFYQRARGGSRQPPFEEFWRYKLILKSFRASGRARFHWITGAVAPEDIAQGPMGSRYLKTQQFLQESVDGQLYNPNSILSRLRCAQGLDSGYMGGDGYEPVRELKVQGFADSHAPTRWRKRNSGTGVDIGIKLMGYVCTMAGQYEENYDAQIESPVHHYAARYYKTVGILNGIQRMGSDLEDWYKKPNPQGSAEQEPPITRWGASGEQIANAWKDFGKIAFEQVAELQKLHTPFTDGNGFEFIKKEDLEPYTDLLQEAITRLSTSVYFDWFNPKSYPGQIDPESYSDKLDLEELLL